MAGELCAHSEEAGSVSYQGTYVEYKHALDMEIRKTAEGFVRVGYLLKIARDTNILFESGYGSVAEFAQVEYGLTKDVVSRYIAINDRYSEDGYSDRLQERFSGYGVAKLAEMLTLPDTVIEAMNPQLTKSQIREVKEEVRAEMEITPIEAALEPQAPDIRELRPLELFLRQYFRENPKKFILAHKYTMQDTDLSSNRVWTEHTLDHMCPAGNGCVTVRIPGRGRLMLFFHGRDQDLELVEIRADEKQRVTWSELREEILRMCSRHEDPERAWETIYEEVVPRETLKGRTEPDGACQKENQPEQSPDQPEEKKTVKKSPIDKLKEKVRKVTGKEKKEQEDTPVHTKAKEPEVAPAQPENGPIDQADAVSERRDPEGKEEFMNLPEIVPAEETEVEYDFWMSRKVIQDGIRELSGLLSHAHWEEMEKTLEKMLRSIHEIRRNNEPK